MDSRRPSRHALFHQAPPGHPSSGRSPPTQHRGEPALQQTPQPHRPSWGPDPPPHMAYHPHSSQAASASNDSSDHSPKHQRHTSHQESFHRQEWSSASNSSNTYNISQAPIGNGYERRRNSYGSSGAQHSVPSYSSGPYSQETSPQSQGPRRDPFDTIHPPLPYQPQQQMQQTSRGGERTLMGGSSPAPFRGPHEPSSMSSGLSFVSRHMPPPPSSPNSYQHHASHQPTPLSSRAAAPPSSTPTFGIGRDLPSLSATPRPGSSMSISSMLGTDPTPRSTSDLLSARLPRAAVPTSASTSPHYATMRAPSPPTSHAYSPYRAPRTPDRYAPMSASGGRDLPADGAGAPQGSPYGSNDQYAHPPKREQSAYNANPSERASRAPQSPADGHARPVYRNYSRSSTPPRLASQSIRSSTPPRLVSQSIRSGNTGPAQEDPGRYVPANTGSRYEYRVQGRGVKQVYDDRGPPPIPEGRHQQYSGSGTPGTLGTMPQHTTPSTHRREYIPDARDGRTDRPETRPIQYRQQEMREARTSDFPHEVDHSHATPEQARTPRRELSERVGPDNHRASSPRRGSQSHLSSGFGIPMPSHPMPSQESGATGLASSFGDGDATPLLSAMGIQPRKGSDESHPSRHHTPRNLLVVAAELGRKGGRMSPLPQAVQGAQSQLSGPGEGPGIKSEFGRMFSGIGSGVGAMAVGGSSPNVNSSQALSTTPTPLQRHEASDAIAISASKIGDELKAIRSVSRGGRKARKSKQQEEVKVDSESGDGRSTPGAVSGRHTKRNKPSGHHHHHVKPHHHHHHHQAKEDDRIASPILTSGPSHRAGLIARASTPSGLSRSVSASHHHHHHHQHPSHEPHAKRMLTPSAPASPYVPPRRAVTTVHSHAVINSVAHHTRHHLGSTLYSPVISVSKPSYHDRFGYMSTPRPLPDFEGKENCTVAMRISQYHLHRDRREEIVRRRAVWGTDVYTDDSDILGALIHAGWIRGAWPDDVDVSLLDLGPEDDDLLPAKKRAKPAPALPSTTLDAPPRDGPMFPPPQRDLHVTLLILPPLQTYASTVRRGLRSRTWGKNHDGMSFMIHRIAWVDAESRLDQSRGGQARRDRLRANLRTAYPPLRPLRILSSHKKSALDTWAVEVVA